MKEHDQECNREDCCTRDKREMRERIKALEQAETTAHEYLDHCGVARVQPDLGGPFDGLELSVAGRIQDARDRIKALELARAGGGVTNRRPLRTRADV